MNKRWLSQQPQQSKYANRLILALRKEAQNQLEVKNKTLPDALQEVKKALEAEWKIDYNTDGTSTMVKTTETGAKVMVTFSLAEVAQGTMPAEDVADYNAARAQDDEEMVKHQVKEFFQKGRIDPQPRDLRNIKDRKRDEKKMSASDEDDSSSDEEKTDEMLKDEKEEKKLGHYYDSKFRVHVFKNGKELKYTCASNFGELMFEDLELRIGQYVDNTSYSSMGQEQRQMYDYFAMEELGINQDLSTYINAFNSSRERRCFMRFLNDVQEIVR
jgi:hypothetical protein